MSSKALEASYAVSLLVAKSKKLGSCFDFGVAVLQVIVSSGKLVVAHVPFY